MSRQTVSLDQLLLQPFSAWDEGWYLLTAGDFAAGKFNSMTVSWGGFGTMWGRPIAMIVVRPQRHTFRFTEQFDSFTLCSFAASEKRKLEVLGSKSGRDMDKINASGFTPAAATTVASPVYEEAELAIECRKNYFQDFDPANFLAPYIADAYKNDYHRMYYGEVVAVSAVEKYVR